MLHFPLFVVPAPFAAPFSAAVIVRVVCTVPFVGIPVGATVPGSVSGVEGRLVLWVVCLLAGPADCPCTADLSHTGLHHYNFIFVSLINVTFYPLHQYKKIFVSDY